MLLMFAGIIATKLTDSYAKDSFIMLTLILWPSWIFWQFNFSVIALKLQSKTWTLGTNDTFVSSLSGTLKGNNAENDLLRKFLAYTLRNQIWKKN